MAGTWDERRLLLQWSSTPPAPHFAIEVCTDARRVTVCLQGEICYFTVRLAQESVETVLSEVNGRALMVDLAVGLASSTAPACTSSKICRRLLKRKAPRSPRSPPRPWSAVCWQSLVSLSARPCPAPTALPDSPQGPWLLHRHGIAAYAHIASREGHRAGPHRSRRPARTAWRHADAARPHSGPPCSTGGSAHGRIGVPW